MTATLQLYHTCGGMIESPNSLYRCTTVYRYRSVPPCTALCCMCTAQRYTTEIFGGQNWWAARSLQREEGKEAKINGGNARREKVGLNNSRFLNSDMVG
eukprot:scaffold208411_cov46-Cyclotella_meneghiniana.AAC.1